MGKKAAKDRREEIDREIALLELEAALINMKGSVEFGLANLRRLNEGSLSAISGHANRVYRATKKVRTS